MAADSLGGEHIAVTTAAEISADLLGGEQIRGSEKYLGGVLGEDGNVYAVPGKAERILKIVTATGETTMIGPVFKGHFKWLRGVQCGPKIYCIPSHHDRWAP
jgi:hypothetical protein